MEICSLIHLSSGTKEVASHVSHDDVSWVIAACDFVIGDEQDCHELSKGDT